MTPRYELAEIDADVGDGQPPQRWPQIKVGASVGRPGRGRLFEDVTSELRRDRVGVAPIGALGSR